MSELISPALLTEIAQALWRGLFAGRGELGPAAAPGTAGGELTARIAIRGAWDGAVDLCCSRAAARTIAAAMLGLAIADPAAADVDDAIGEVVNILGGSVKGLLPDPTELSMPLVAPSAELPPPAAAALLAEAALSWRAEPIVIRVWSGSVALATRAP